MLFVEVVEEEETKCETVLILELFQNFPSSAQLHIMRVVAREERVVRPSAFPASPSLAFWEFLLSRVILFVFFFL